MRNNFELNAGVHALHALPEQKLQPTSPQAPLCFLMGRRGSAFSAAAGSPETFPAPFGAVDAFDEDLMSLVSSALQGISDNLVSLPKEECDRLALLALKVDQNGVQGAWAFLGSVTCLHGC